MNFIRQRFFHQRYYIGLLLGLFIIICHIYFGQISDLRWLDGVHLDHLAVIQWLGFDINSTFANIFFFSMPILCSLGPSLAVTEDLKSGFVNRMVQFSLYRYLVTNLVISFLGGVLIGIIPPILDFLIALWLFPDKIPNLVINYGQALAPRGTFVPKLFYENPILSILMYLLIIGITGGIFSLFSVLSGVVFRNQYFAMSSPFVLVTIITLLAGQFPNFIYSPTYIMISRSPLELPSLSGLIFVYILLFVGLIGVICYVFKKEITIK